MPWWVWLNYRNSTYDFGLEKRIIEVMKMHVNLIGWDQDRCDTEDKWRVILIPYGGLDAVLVTVNKAVRWDVAFIYHLLIWELPDYYYLKSIILLNICSTIKFLFTINKLNASKWCFYIISAISYDNEVVLHKSSVFSFILDVFPMGCF